VRALVTFDQSTHPAVLLFSERNFSVPAHAIATTPYAGNKIRVLVVDDSVVVRRLVTKALALDEEFEVVGTASSAESALERLSHLHPDVITLDIHMTGMTGLELLPILRERFPRLHVLIFSSSSEGSVAGTVDALLCGANGFLLKPFIGGSLDTSLEYLQQELSANIKQLFRRIPAHTVTTGFRPPRPELVRSRSHQRPDILAIGVSTGGPTALARVMEGLPHNFALPVVIVQHMPPVFTKLLANRIRATTGFNIVEGTEGMMLEPGKAILAPGDFHMRLARAADGSTRIKLDQGPQECSCRPAVDVLFRSVAEIYKGNVIATILTGMGQDGLRGATELTRLGAYLIAQDEASSVVWGMPGAVANAGIANEVLPLDNIAAAIAQQVRSR
jgi:two-component system chemotaxis response regulator CheB